MNFAKLIKKVIIVVIILLSILLLCYACSHIILQKLLPDNPGNRDWRYVLHNGYEILHLNSTQIILQKDGWSEYTSIVIDGQIIAFCNNDRYIGIQKVDSSVKVNYDNCYPEYYLVDSEENQLYGPFTETEYQEYCATITIINFGEWINTSPAPEGAVYQ